MKKIAIALLGLALAQTSTVSLGQKVQRKPVAKALTLPVLSIDEEDAACAGVAINSAEDATLSAEEREGFKGMGFYFLGRVSGRTNLTIAETMDRFVAKSANVTKIIQNPKLEALLMDKCATRFSKLTGE